jgi:predicted amino acid dehydrogenase
MDEVLAALDEVLHVISRNNEAVLVGHLVGVPPSAAERSDPPPVALSHPQPTRRVDFDARIGFVVHPANVDHISRYYFPALEGRVQSQQLATWWSRLGRFLEPDVVHTDYISSEGFVVEANFVAVPFLPRHLIRVFARAGRKTDPERLDLLRLQESRDKIQDAVTTLKELGDDHIPTSMVGLGAFTSIITNRGKTINDYEVPVTTGNAYTAGLMIQGILKAAEIQHIALPDARAAVVGAAGNIGSVLAAILSGHVGRLRLVGRESSDGLRRLRNTRLQCLLYLAHKAREQVKAGRALDAVSVGGLGDRLLHEILLPALRSSDATSGWARAEKWLRGTDGDAPELGSLLEEAMDRHGGTERNDYITLHQSVEAVRDCDLVTIATSSCEGRLITPELVKKGAVVSCASVPSNLSEAFSDHLQDYLVFDGGYARLPEGQEIDCVGIPRKGLAFGCLSETLLLGFDGRNSSFAKGPIKPEQVEQTLEMADLYGFELGDFKLNEEAHPSRLLNGVGRVCREEES